MGLLLQIKNKLITSYNREKLIAELKQMLYDCLPSVQSMTCSLGIFRMELSKVTPKQAFRPIDHYKIQVILDQFKSLAFETITYNREDIYELNLAYTKEYIHTVYDKLLALPFLSTLKSKNMVIPIYSYHLNNLAIEINNELCDEQYPQISNSILIEYNIKTSELDLINNILTATAIDLKKKHPAAQVDKEYFKINPFFFDREVILKNKYGKTFTFEFIKNFKRFAFEHDIHVHECDVSIEYGKVFITDSFNNKNSFDSLYKRYEPNRENVIEWDLYREGDTYLTEFSYDREKVKIENHQFSQRLQAEVSTILASKNLGHFSFIFRDSKIQALSIQGRKFSFDQLNRKSDLYNDQKAFLIEANIKIADLLNGYQNASHFIAKKIANENYFFLEF